MNNKSLGNKFEKDFADFLAKFTVIFYKFNKNLQNRL